MDRLTTFVAVSLLAVFSLAGEAAFAAETPDSLIPNPGFEVDANSDGVPDGWPKASENVQYLSENGNHFVRLKSTEVGKMVLIYRLIDLQPTDKAFELSFRVRYEGIKPGANPWFDGRVMMNFKDAEKKVVKGAPGAPNFKGTNKEWQSRTVKLTVPEGAKTLEIMPCLFQVEAGSIDFDDLKLVRMASQTK